MHGRIPVEGMSRQPAPQFQTDLWSHVPVGLIGIDNNICIRYRFHLIVFDPGKALPGKDITHNSSPSLIDCSVLHRQHTFVYGQQSTAS